MSERENDARQFTKIEGLSGRELYEQMERSLGEGERQVLCVAAAR